MQLNDFTTLDPGTFKLRRYEVSVSGFSEPMSAVYLSTSRGKAMADAWRSDIFSNYTFGEFLKIARCRLSWYQAKPTEIEVLGERVWGLGHNRQYVQFVRPNGDHVLNAHPLDVLPVSARPKDYQPAPSTSTPPASRGEGRRLKMDELKPCPFCGGEAIGITYIRDGWRATCGCGAAAKSCFHGPADMPSAEQRAVTAWNTRPPVTDEMVERAARALALEDRIEICSDATYRLSSYGPRARAALTAALGGPHG